MAIEGKLISIGLFAGAFGLDLGLEKAGFQTVSVVEKDSDSTRTIAINRPCLSNSAIPRDIKDINAFQLLKEGGKALNLGRSLKPGEVDLITGGPPCQPFSTAGKRSSIGDPRGSLFKDFVRIVREIQPRFFIMENVRGLLSAPIKHRPHNQRGASYPALTSDEMSGAALNIILTEIENIGYKVAYRLLQAADYGVPQTRLRVIFIASRDSEKITFPEAVYHDPKKNITPYWLTLKNALSDLVETNKEYVSYAPNRIKYLKLLKAGQNWRFLPEELKPEAMGGAYKSGGGKVGFYRRLSWNKPSPTITTSPHQKATDMCHPEELRPLTVRECARIQTFPDEWIFHGSISSKYRQIGNAVPALLGKAIGEHILKIMQGKDIFNEPITYQLTLFKSAEIPSVKINKTALILNMKSEKQALKILLQDSGVKRASLLAEKISTLDNYLNLTEEEISQIQWVDKKGKYISMVKKSEADKITAKRDLYLKNENRIDEYIARLYEVSRYLSDILSIKNLLKEFVSSKKATILANEIKTVDNIQTHSTAFSETLNILSNQEKEDIVNLFLQKNRWDNTSIENLQWNVDIFAKSIYIKGKINNCDLTIHNEETYQFFKKYFLKNWYRISKQPKLFISDCQELGFIKNNTEQNKFEILAKLLLLEERHLDIALLFLNEIIKMTADVPGLAKKAIHTGNPFLFRSLFSNFREAEQFAIGGKLNSSLETKYGNLFEKLMLAFSNGRAIYDGGLDVIVGDSAFDIKSGPSVMNKSMVDAFSAKQVLIQDRKILPGIKNYKIALGYGRRDNLNSFMAKIDSEILTAREAWKEITGIEHSPEIVFAIASLIPQIFESESIINSILYKTEYKPLEDINHSQFTQLFNNHFDEINLTSEAQKEIKKIENLL